VWNPTASNPQAAQDSLGTAYLYGHEGHLGDITVLGEYSNVTGTPTAQHIYLPTPQGPLPVLAVIGGTRYAVLADHLHTPRRLQQTQLITNWQWPYSAFGEEPPTQRKYRFVNPATVNLGETTTAAPLNYNLRFPGQVADAESGLFYNYFRSYDSRTGRYSQSDPIGLGGGWNRFGYVEGNALGFTDPLGLLNSQVTDFINRNRMDTSKCATAECAAGLLPKREAKLSPEACFAACFTAKTGSGLLLGAGVSAGAAAMSTRAGVVANSVMNSEISILGSEMVGIEYCYKKCNFPKRDICEVDQLSNILAP
jgi:RHS repeat-associated protein